MISIKSTIKDFEKKHHRLSETMYDLKESFGDENKLWEQLEKTDDEFFYNCKGFDFLADSLQLVDNAERLKMFELKDIEKMYRLLVEYYPNNLQYKIDLINFVYAVLDDETEALNLIAETQQQLHKYNESVNLILSEIKG